MFSQGKGESTPFHAWPVRPSGLQPLSATARTGQTKCFDTAAEIACLGTGQDGELRPGVAWSADRFADLGDGTVIDRFTGLVWTKDASPAPGGTIDWQTALDAVAALNTAVHLGRDDWRLPNAEEMASLIDLSTYIPALPGGPPFTDLQVNSYYWTSTTFGGTQRLALLSGEGYLAAKDASDTSNNYYWPVRGGITGPVNFADLSTSIDDTPDPVDAGATLTYAIDVVNAGPDPAPAVSVLDNVPASATVLSAVTDVGSCVVSG